MLFQIFLFLLAGTLAGTITGLVPGVHINLIGLFIVTASTSFLFINPIYFVVFITAMAITHTFIDFIPSIFLGCPDTDTELSVLPGHELLKKGLGYEAIVLTAYGSLAAVFILLLIAFPSIFLISKIKDYLPMIIPGLLILASFFLISTEQRKIPAFIAFTLSGILGLIVLNLEILKEPLLPLLTGLFGSSMLIISIKNKTQIPNQTITKIKTKLFKPLLGALVAAPICSFLPGMGAGQAAIIGNWISKQNRKGFLVLLGATNTLVMGFSFISLYIIAKTRTGAAVAIQEIIGLLNYKTLILILSITLISGILAFFLTIFLAKFFSTKLEKVNYTILSSITLIVLILIVFLMSGFSGLGVFIAATLIGLYCISLKVRRTQMMGCLLLPTIIFYLF